ncbi:hypothetical protein LTR85_007893 [Meristemomyces frigidus]|nr:hypothetical protein LTR85_007893 [Meristemomyces frigidus]
MRTGGAKPASLLTILGGKGRKLVGKGTFYMLLALLLAVSTALLQLTSTALVFDLYLGTLPGRPFISSLSYDVRYTINTTSAGAPFVYRPTTWLRNPPASPAYAKFAEPLSVPDHVDDTGVLHRAFLPYTDAHSRETLRNYSGRALVFDSRVSCQPPELLDLSFSTQDTVVAINLNGTFAPTKAVPGLKVPARHVPFSCSVLIGEGVDSSFNTTSIKICQISGFYPGDAFEDPGCLISDLLYTTLLGELQGSINFDVKTMTLANAPYLIINSTQLTSYPALFGLSTFYSTNSSGLVLYNATTDNTLAFAAHGPWTDLVSQKTNLNLSVTLCYPALYVAGREVQMFSSENRTEPVAKWAPDDEDFSVDGYFTSPDVHTQMGETGTRPTSQSADSRGTGLLQEYDLTAMIEIDDGGLTTQEAADPLINALIPDYTLATLFTQSPYVSNGSVATAMSTLLTTLSSMAYYDQMLLYQTADDVTQIFFTTVLFPQSYRGFAAVVAVLIFHHILIVAITVAFMVDSHFTALGNHWQSISQLLSSETEALIMRSSRATDKDIQRQLKAEGLDHFQVGLVPLEHGDWIGMAGLNRKRRGPRRAGA